MAGFFRSLSIEGFLTLALPIALIIVAAIFAWLKTKLRIKFFTYWNEMLSRSVTGQGLVQEYLTMDKALGKISKAINNSQNVSIYTGLGAKIINVIELIKPGVNVTVYLANSDISPRKKWCTFMATTPC